MANEKRLIWDVDMKTAFREWFDRDDFRTMNQVIDDIPTVDAVEVVHGEWTIMDDDYLCLTTLECSVCGEQYCFEEYDEQMPPHYHYCPNCGAKMDGGNENGK